MTSSRSSNQNLFAFLPILGLALIIFGFFLLVPTEKRNATAWLDLIVVSALFLLLFVMISPWRLRADGFDTYISKLSVLLPLSIIFTALSLGIVIVGWVQGISFNYQLFAQLLLSFGILVGASLAILASKQVEKVAGLETQTSESLQTLKVAILGCEKTMADLGPEWNQERESLRKLKENARYLSPSVEPDAISYDQQLCKEIQELSDVIHMPSQPEAKRNEVRAKLEKCTSLMSFRKQS